MEMTLIGYILIGINCFLAGYQYCEYRQNELRKRNMKDLLKRIEEDDYKILKATADKIYGRIV
jgi:hypothetical protein